VAAPAVPAQPSSSPTQQFSAYTDQVLKLLQERDARGLGTPEKMRAAIHASVIRIFGLNDAAREALGRHWQPRTPPERDEFVRLFTDLIEATYIAQLNREGGVRLRYTGQTINGDHAEVTLAVLTRRGSELKVLVKLDAQSERWLISDIAIEGVSLVQTYRVQFERVIRRGSYADLVREIRTKIETLYRPKT
jgi:phospholipid transport system substrate-binding protein